MCKIRNIGMKITYILLLSGGIPALKKIVLDRKLQQYTLAADYCLTTFIISHNDPTA